MTTIRPDLELLHTIPTSYLGVHPGWCCTATRGMVTSLIVQHSDLGSQLAAIPAVVPWGPTAWPAHWCDLQPVGDGTGTSTGFVGDCGVHALLASEVLTRAGVRHTRGHAAVRADPESREHWRALWGTDPDASTRWIGASLVHHEVIRVGNRWWDPTESAWFDGVGSRLRSGTVVALWEDEGAWQMTPGAGAGPATPTA